MEYELGIDILRDDVLLFLMVRRIFKGDLEK